MVSIWIWHNDEDYAHAHDDRNQTRYAGLIRNSINDEYVGDTQHKVPRINIFSNVPTERQERSITRLPLRGKNPIYILTFAKLRQQKNRRLTVTRYQWCAEKPIGRCDLADAKINWSGKTRSKNIGGGAWLVCLNGRLCHYTQPKLSRQTRVQREYENILGSWKMVNTISIGEPHLLLKKNAWIENEPNWLCIQRLTTSSIKALIMST